MTVMTGLSGNEIFCLRKKGLSPGDMVIGNSVYSMGFLGSLWAGISTLTGGEVTQVTDMVHQGRLNSYTRMVAEATKHGGVGITGVSNELIQQQGNVEFLSIGSCLHQDGARSEQLAFSSSADGQELYCQMDAGFRPIKFVFGNVAYSIGVGGGIGGMFKSMQRGEIEQYSQIFNQTRHLALQRITNEARSVGANAVVGIETSIIPFQGMQEMVMIGTASFHPALPPQHAQAPITSDLTNEEMWNLVNMGYMPLQLLLGVSVYSVGIVGGLTAALKSFSRGEINELTTLIYEARENAIGKISRDAQAVGADDVVGIKTYVYALGSGIIEFLAIGTAVKKIPGLTTVSENLPPQALIRDKSTFVNTAEMAIGTNLNSGQKPGGSSGD
jgi:uncharacterized protein YbjQ (UPF0145 family)